MTISHTYEDIKRQLKRDINRLGLPVDFTLTLKLYSVRYEGRYNPNVKNVILYLYADKGLMLRHTYEHLLTYAIHEAVHHFQWKHDPTFKRVHGVMHNDDFKRIYKSSLELAHTLNILKKEKLCC